jgi:hypothetical protein
VSDLDVKAGRPGTEAAMRWVSAPRGLRESVLRIRARLGIDELGATALGIWVMSRVAVFAFAWNVTWITQPAAKFKPRGFGGLWQRWDWLRYVGIAQHGYSLHARHGSSIAFFPGYPIVLATAQLVLRSWVYTGLIISLLAGAVAAVALSRIIALEARIAFGTGVSASDVPGAEGTADERVRSAVRDGVLFWVFAPAAFFLAAGYTESLFLALVMPAWLAAKRGRWLAAGVLLAGASAVRVNGLFVFVGVVVMFLQTRPHGRREWLRGAPLLIALTPVIAFVTYLHSLTGSWTAWQKAEATGWNRHFTEPLRTFINTWRYAFGEKALKANNAWEYQLEIVAMAVGVALLVWLVARRRWPEAAYVTLSVGALATSNVFLSVPREMLLWWPLWAALGVWTVRQPWIRTVYLTVAAPLMFTVSYLFLMGLWAG